MSLISLIREALCTEVVFHWKITRFCVAQAVYLGVGFFTILLQWTCHWRWGALHISLPFSLVHSNLWATSANSPEMIRSVKCFYAVCFSSVLPVWKALAGSTFLPMLHTKSPLLVSSNIMCFEGKDRVKQKAFFIFVVCKSPRRYYIRRSSAPYMAELSCGVLGCNLTDISSGRTTKHPWLVPAQQPLCDCGSSISCPFCPTCWGLSRYAALLLLLRPLFQYPEVCPWGD